MIDGDRLPLRPAEQQVVLNHLAGVYPDDEIARRLNVNTRTVLRHRSRDQLPGYSGHIPRPNTPAP